MLLRKTDYITLGGLVAIGCFVILTLAWLNGCSPAAQQQVTYKIEEGSHSAELADCLRAAKADSGTLAEFCVCWNAKNAKYNVDAGECR